MSDIIGNFTVYYLADPDNRQKRIKWTGSATDTNTVAELYSALQDLFDEPAQMDVGIPMAAQTPTEYTIGIIDAGDNDPWFIDDTTITHLTGGAINTVYHTRVQDENTGIVHVSRTGSNIVVEDIGLPISHADGDTGTLLDINGQNDLIIRPTNSTSTHNWDSALGDITCNGHTDVQSGAAGTGETLYANIYSLGTIASNTDIYIVQDGAKITSWWPSGHIDVLIETRHIGTLIDSGILTVYARQYSKLYDHYEIVASSGGRNPIPLATSADTNNTTGYKSVALDGATGTWDVGNGIYFDNGGTYTWATTTKKGIITSGGSGATPTLEYYLIGDGVTDFSNNDAVTEYVVATGANGADGDINGSSSAVGPATSPSSTVTIGLGGIPRDLNNDYGSAPYSVEIDLQNTVAIGNLYERLKYLTRRGQTTDIETQTSQSIIGQEYIAVGDLYIPYDTGSVDNPFTEGETITATGGFTCTLTSKHDQGSSEGFIIVRKVRGTTPVNDVTLTGTTSTHTALVDTNGGLDPVAAISPSKTSPFGTFAGGRFFGARGVWLANVPGASANNYQLIDSENNPQTPPATVSLSVNGVASEARVSLFRAVDANGAVNKSMFTFDTPQTIGSSIITIAETIPADTPAKNGPTGYLRVVRRDGPGGNIINEQRYTYESWSSSTFTLLSGTITSYAYDTNDTVYVPYIDEQAPYTADPAGTSVSKSVIYVSDRDVVVRVRKKGILPWEQKGRQIDSTGFSATATITEDSIVT